MKKLHIGMIITCFVLLCATTCWGLLYSYVSQKTIPGQLKIGFSSIEGLRLEDALAHLEKEWDNFEHQSIIVNLKEHNDGAQGTRGGSEHEWTLERLGYKIERQPIRDKLLQLEEGSLLERAKYRFSFPDRLELHIQSDKKRFSQQVQQHWGWIEDSKPVSAERRISDNDRVTYKEHSVAYRLNFESLFQQVSEWVSSIKEGYKTPDFELTLRVLQPEVTLENLKAEGIERKIVSYTTDFSTSGQGRAHNVTSTARTLHNWVLLPDEIFDYRKVIHATDEHYGFREAPVILNGELVPGIGGGICQVSSTLYNAALLVGLEIVERRNHSLPVSYLPKGRDATFSDGYINFRFRNTTGKHLLIRTEVEGYKLTVKLFGTIPEEIHYRIETELVRTIEPPVNEVIQKSGKRGTRKVVQPGKPGYVVDVYSVEERSGKEVGRQRISRDTYRPQPTIIAVTDPDSPASGTRTDSDSHPDDGRASTDNSASGGNTGAKNFSDSHPLLEDGLRLIDN
ncbi:hypothetical protein EBB07_09470 [Paenibacillaceae bacterium]|nr:hypothetical protein EBB07_09470 [Paenibacillaceae bacterium]